MPGTLGSFPKLRWKLEAQDKVYVCVCGGGSISMIASHPRHSMVNCVLLSLFYRQHSGSLGNSGQWGYRIWLWKWPHGTTLPSYDTKTSQGTSLRVGFGSVTSANWRLLDESGWRETTNHPFQALHKDSGMDHGWAERKSCFSKQWHLVTHQNTHTTYHEKIFGAEHSNLF